MSDFEEAIRDAQEWKVECRRLEAERDQLRAELADLTAKLDASKFCADVADDLRAELAVMTQHADNYSKMFEDAAEEIAAIKAQEPVGYRCWFNKEPEKIMAEWGRTPPAGRLNAAATYQALYAAPVAKQVVMPGLIEKLREIAIRERIFRIEETYTAPEISDSISLLNNEMDEVASLNAADQEGGV